MCRHNTWNVLKFGVLFIHPWYHIVLWSSLQTNILLTPSTKSLLTPTSAASTSVNLNHRTEATKGLVLLSSIRQRDEWRTCIYPSIHYFPVQWGFMLSVHFISVMEGVGSGRGFTGCFRASCSRTKSLESGTSGSRVWGEGSYRLTVWCCWCSAVSTLYVNVLYVLHRRVIRASVVHKLFQWFELCGWQDLLVSSLLMCNLKYINRFLMDCHEILYRYSWSNPSNFGNSLTFPLAPPTGHGLHVLYETPNPNPNPLFHVSCHGTSSNMPLPT